jgi:predicted ribonuclease toxin of YeeF-YezG toxin-antitoxin module
MSSDECLDITDSGENRGKEQSDKDGLEKSEIGELKDQYIEELLDYSDCPETIDTDKFKNAELEKVDPQENAKRREEFNEKKKDLIKEWETENGREWPRYEEDVYSDSGKLIRKAGQPYDAHHIQPLSMGGKNTADNITPLHAQDHYDRQGVHSFGSAYSKLETKLEQKGC